jgi:hypothetical protein
MGANEIEHGMMADERAEIERILPSIASTAFPEDTGVRWHIRNTVSKSGFFCVEAEPVPATVGYPCFRFVLGRDASGALVDHGCYCLDRGA